MQQRFFFLLALLALMMFPVKVFAIENWVVDDFHSQVMIQADGKVSVTETIAVDFAAEQKHGIYRDIPYIYTTEKNQYTYTDVQVTSVLQDGSAGRYQVSKEGNYVRVKMGDSVATISGPHHYQIQYLAIGVLRSFTDHDELYWDVTGNGWPVPITKVTAVVQLPRDGLTRVTCLEGPFRSAEPCVSHLDSAHQGTFQSARSLGAEEGMTIVAGFTKGLVPMLTVSRSAATGFPDLMISVIVAGIGSAAVIVWWWKKGREQRAGRETVMVEYGPPENLRPAEVGTLFDERADTLDVTATIIDLAARGFLTITELPKKWLFGNTDYRLDSTKKDSASLLAYEKSLLDKLFLGRDSVTMATLKQSFYEDLADVKEQLYQDVVAKKFFSSNPEKVRGIYSGSGTGLLAASVAATIVGFSSSRSLITTVGIGCFPAALFLLVLSRSFSRRTAIGHRQFRKILGFKLFIDKVETYKQQVLERQNLFNEILPYAIVFGATEKFAKAFADLGIKPPQPTWYYSSQPFNLILFSSNINSFSNSMTSAIAAQPARNSFASSGSGFSGGFSGGGFGGGGGGSW